MKGVANLVWVAGGVIVGLIIFSIAYNQIANLSASLAERRSVEYFDEIKSTINNLCWRFYGNKEYREVRLAETVKGIYVSKDKYGEYKDLTELVMNKSFGEGSYICIKVKGKRAKCEELECNATMPFIGAVPTKFSLSALIDRIIGRGKTFYYCLSFLRDESGVSVSFCGEEFRKVKKGTTSTISSTTTTTIFKCKDFDLTYYKPICARRGARALATTNGKVPIFERQIFEQNSKSILKKVWVKMGYNRKSKSWNLTVWDKDGKVVFTKSLDLSKLSDIQASGSNIQRESFRISTLCSMDLIKWKEITVPNLQLPKGKFYVGVVNATNDINNFLWICVNTCGGPGIESSTDLGKTWKKDSAPSGYPENTIGIKVRICK